MRHFIYFSCSQFRLSFFAILISACLPTSMVSGQVSIKKSQFQEREAFALQNDKMRLSMLSGGGYIAELSLIFSDGKESVNPLFIPHYQTIDPHDYRPEKHEDLYGSGNSSKLAAGYMGHYLCFPYFGGRLSVFEQKTGNGTHGEAYTVKYEVEEKMEDIGASLSASAVLPLNKYAINRTFTMLPGQSVVLVEEAMKNLESFDRPYQWVQHITFGNPFLEYGKTFVDAPVSRIAFSPLKDDPANSNSVQWPILRTEGVVDKNVGVFGSDKGEGGYSAWLMDPEREYTWFTMYNMDFKLLVGYVYSKDENPWIGDWQENQRSRSLPRDGKTIAWGLEVGTTPFDSGIKQSIDHGPLFNTETYRWFGAKEEKVQSYLIFLLEIDKGFKGVKDLELEKGSIVLTERESGKQIRVANGFTLQ